MFSLLYGRHVCVTSIPWSQRFFLIFHRIRELRIRWKIRKTFGTRVTQTWRLHTKLYKFGWHASANNSRMKNSRDVILGEVVYISMIYRIQDSDHVYFVHPSTDISADISTDSDRCIGRPIGISAEWWSTYRPTIGRYRPTIGRYLGRYSGRHPADMSTIDCRWSIGRLSVVYRSSVL